MPRRVVGILSLLLVFAFKMRAQGEVVLSIGGEPVKRTEFEYYFRKSHKHTPDSFLSSFINYKLKVHYAHDTGIDTLSAFRRQMAWYRGKLLKKYLVDAEKEEQTVRQLYLRSEQRLQTNDWIRIAHISKYLPQNVGRQGYCSKWILFMQHCREVRIFLRWLAGIQMIRLVRIWEGCYLGCL